MDTCSVQDHPVLAVVPGVYSQDQDVCFSSVDLTCTSRSVEGHTACQSVPRQWDACEAADWLAPQQEPPELPTGQDWPDNGVLAWPDNGVLAWPDNGVLASAGVTPSH